MENLKTVLKFVFTAVNAGETAYKNNHKIDLADAGLLLGPLLMVPALMQSIKTFDDEYNNMTDAQEVELYAWIKEEFDITDDKAEVRIEASMKVLIAARELVQAFKS